MRTLVDALHDACVLIASLDSDVIQYASRSLLIALLSTFIAATMAVPLGILIAERDFPRKRLLVTILNTLLGIPTVAVGLLVYAFIGKRGPLGALDMLFTVPGIILGEVVLIIPLVTALTLTAVTRIDRDVRRAAMALGANELQTLQAIFREARFGILAAVIAGYGRVVGEVGVATILGGNADGFTRTLTTAIVVNINMGYFERALALGIVLLSLSFLINIMFQLLQGGGRNR